MGLIDSPYKVKVHVEFGQYANNWCSTNIKENKWWCSDFTEEYYHTYIFQTPEEASALAKSIRNINYDYVIYDEKVLYHDTNEGRTVTKE